MHHIRFSYYHIKEKPPGGRAASRAGGDWRLGCFVADELELLVLERVSLSSVEWFVNRHDFGILRIPPQFRIRIAHFLEGRYKLRDVFFLKVNFRHFFVLSLQNGH